MEFADKIINWYSEHKRDLPWRTTKDPYLVWLSEIILQQTRVDQGMSYYLKFAKNYPTVQDLAEASEEQVLKDWQGLGYYSRARNLHGSAKLISNELNGNFPSTYSEIIKLKGVGGYTASAISSFCFDEPNAVVDGNVYRVLSRIFGLETPIDSGKGQKEFKTLANELISKKDPASFNQGIMEFGSLACTPSNPNCSECIFSEQCVALADGKIKTLPVKANKIKVKDRFIEYFIFQNNTDILLNHRVEKDIWQHLFDFPMLDSKKELTEEEVRLELSKISATTRVSEISSRIKHLLSHQKLSVRFWTIDTPQMPEGPDTWKVISKSELQNYALPKVVENYLNSLS